LAQTVYIDDVCFYLIFTVSYAEIENKLHTQNLQWDRVTCYWFHPIFTRSVVSLYFCWRKL